VSTDTTTAVASVDDRREQAWAELNAAISAGCPVPTSVYIAASATMTTVTVQSTAEVDTWAAWLGLPPATVLVYPVDNGTGYQRTTEANRSHPNLRVSHHAQLTRAAWEDSP